MQEYAIINLLETIHVQNFLCLRGDIIGLLDSDSNNKAIRLDLFRWSKIIHAVTALLWSRLRYLVFLYHPLNTVALPVSYS